ncbi:LpqB family beta-propeller domain-containing protein [Cnuibacter sp. UC19_7]|uniref:LpqB family beta-propeller domain-containing protein n=1 Tax=Cnuibacter sp. UC19_7 TaxID=3350166 RepID=UPI00366E2A49
MREWWTMLRRGAVTRVGAVIAVLALAVSLAACAAIPRSGDVGSESGPATDDNIDVIFLAAGPSAGATQAQILAGFVNAAKDPQNDYEVARNYLSQGFAAQWKPTADVIVDSGPRSTTPTSDTSLRLTVTPQARVDAEGSYSETSSAPISLDFSFVQQDGEWRISAAPDGTLIEDVFFEQVFSSHSLYFFDPTYTFLVPDLRWFPTSASVGTRIVRSLLQGPTPWLDGAVVSAFPDGTSTSSVVTSNGTTRVELSSNVLQASTIDLQRMRFQLSASLGGVASVSSVAISVDQNVVDVPSTDRAAPEVAPRVGLTPLVLFGGRFGYLSADAVAEIPGVSDAVVALQPTAVAYSARTTVAAVRAGDGTVAAVRVGGTTTVDQRAGLIAPAVDPFGWVWSIPADDPDAVVAASPGNAASNVPAQWGGASEIRSFEISRDGTRAVAYLVSGGVPQLVVAAVLRDQAGTPTGLGQPVVLAGGSGTPVDATWVDQYSVAAVYAAPSGEPEVLSQLLGGRSSALGSPTGADGIAGGNDLDSMRVHTVDGTLLQLRGSAWQVVADDVTVLAVQN